MPEPTLDELLHATSHPLLEAVAERLTDPVFLFDGQETIRKVFGRATDELAAAYVGRPVSEVFPGWRTQRYSEDGRQYFDLTESELPDPDRLNPFRVVQVLQYEATPGGLLLFERKLPKARQFSQQTLQQMDTAGWREIYQSAGVGICVTDAQGRFFDFNEVYASIYGYAREELIGQPFTLVVRPEDREYALRTHDQFIAGVPELPGHWQVRHKDGSIRDVFVSGSLLETDDGRRFKITTVQDVTEALRSQHLLEQAEQNLGIGSWKIDPLTQEFSISPQFRRILGLGGNENFGLEDLFERIYPEDLPQTRRALHGVIDGSPIDLKYRIRRKDGELLWVHVTSRPLRDKHGRVKSILGTYVDITDLRASETELRKLILILQRTRVSVLITNPQGYVTWVNQAFTDVTGFELQEILGRKPGEFLQGADSDPETVAYISEKLREVEPFSVEILNYTKNGTPIWFQLDIEPLFDEFGNLINFYSVQTNITERKANQRLIAEKQTFLELAQESAKICSWEHDLKTHAFRWSDSVFEIHDWPRERGYPDIDAIRSLIHPEDVTDYLNNYSKLLADGLYYTVDLRIITPKNQVKWVNLAGKILRDEAGEPARILGTTTDITYRKTVENKLRESETRLREAQETAHIGHFEWDIERQTAELSDEVFRIIGYPVGQPPGVEVFIQQLAMAERERIQAHIQAAIAEHRSHTGDYLYYTPAGEEKYLNIIGKPRARNDGYVTHLYGTIMDITARKQLEERLRAERDLLDSVLRTSVAAIVIVDAEGCITFANENAESLIGLECVSTPAGNPQWQPGEPMIIQDADGKEVAATAPGSVYAKVLAGETVSEYPVTLYFEDRPEEQRVVHLLVSGEPIRNEDNQVLLAVFSLRDVTRERKDRQQIRESLREKEVLLKEVHHRVKNNLAVISSMLNMQARREENADTVLSLLETRSRVYSMALIHEKLYQQEDTGGVEFRRYLVSLVRSIRQFNASPEKLAINIEIEAPEELHIALPQAIPAGLTMNEALVNTMKHAFRPGDETPQVKVILRRAGETVLLAVADNGRGLQPSAPQAEPRNRKRSIGMNLMRGLVRQLEGELCIAPNSSEEVATLLARFADTPKFASGLFVGVVFRQ